MMNIKIVENQEEWKKFINFNKDSFLQSWDWGIFQEKIGRKVYRFASDNVAASVLEFNLPFNQKYWYIPYGPIYKNNSLEDFFDFFISLKEIALKQGIAFLRFDPQLEFSSEYYKKMKEAGFFVSKEVQPKETLVIDLLKSDEDLLRDMEHDTRYSIRSAQKRNIIIKIYEKEEKSHIFEFFWKIFQETNKKHNLKTYTKKYFESLLSLNSDCHSEIFTAELENKIIAAAIIIFYGTQASYLYAASLPGFGKYNAPSLILWTAFKEAKKKGCKNFDLWGISNLNKKWAKFTQFKRSFGGKEITRIGAWDYPINRPFYWFYRLLKVFRG